MSRIVHSRRQRPDGCQKEAFIVVPTPQPVDVLGEKDAWLPWRLFLVLTKSRAVRMLALISLCVVHAVGCVQYEQFGDEFDSFLVVFWPPTVFFTGAELYMALKVACGAEKIVVRVAVVLYVLVTLTMTYEVAVEVVVHYNEDTVYIARSVCQRALAIALLGLVGLWLGKTALFCAWCLAEPFRSFIRIRTRRDEEQRLGQLDAVGVEGALPQYESDNGQNLEILAHKAEDAAYNFRCGFTISLSAAWLFIGYFSTRWAPDIFLLGGLAVWITSAVFVWTSALGVLLYLREPTRDKRWGSPVAVVLLFGQILGMTVLNPYMFHAYFHVEEKWMADTDVPRSTCWWFALAGEAMALLGTAPVLLAWLHDAGILHRCIAQ